MKLSYRGAHYEYEPPALDMIEGSTMAKYRGQDYNVRYPRHIPVPQVPLDLKYRGVSYSTHQTPEPEFPGIKRSEQTPVTEPLSVPKVRRTSLLEVAKTHQAYLLQRLEHRLQVARAKGDRDLIQQLEMERAQLV